MKEKYIQIATTISTRQRAEKIARELVSKRLAACVQITGPMKSIYRWKGKIENTKEWACLIKTRKMLYKKVEGAIRKIHPYEVPEVIAVSIAGGSKDYLEWLSSETIKNHG